MSGVKGRSGRKPLIDEVTKADVINMSWTTIRKALTSHSIPDAEKIKIAVEIVKKTCPQSIEHSGSIDGEKTQIVIVTTKETTKNGESENIRADRQTTIGI